MKTGHAPVSGVDLTLNQDLPAVAGARRFCAVLTCEEDTNDRISGKNHAESTFSFKNVSSMSVFKVDSTGRNTADKNKQEVLIASLNTLSPSINLVADGKKVDGSLEVGRAKIQVELFKRDDCQAQFICHVRGLDSQGREAVSTASLVQQPRKRGNQMDDGGLMPVLSLQLLTSIQQLVTQSVAGLEDKIESVEHRVTTKMESVEHLLTDKIEDEIKSIDKSVQDKIEQAQKDFQDRSRSFELLLQDRFMHLENRMEDKIDNNNNLNKLIELDVKVSTELAQFRSDAKAEILNSLDTLKQKIQRKTEDRLVEVSNKIQKTIDNTSALLFSLESDFDQIKMCGETNLLVVENQTDTLQQILASVGSSRDDITVSNSEVMMHLEQFESNIHNLTTVVETNLQSWISDPDCSRSNNAEPISTYISTSKSCKKRSVFIQSHNIAPYTLVIPGQDNTDMSSFPYLCDTESDRGGWIVIQRRSSGNIDFNRGWEEYKVGFGSFFDDFWLGNDKIHAITSNGTYELDIKMRFEGKEKYARYTEFSLGNEGDNYRLDFGHYYGTAGDSLKYHKGLPFSTADKDNDQSSGNCAVSNGGGWWFKDCDTSNLNGKWGADADLGLEWNAFANAQSVSYSEMKIRQM